MLALHHPTQYVHSSNLCNESLLVLVSGPFQSSNIVFCSLCIVMYRNSSAACHACVCAYDVWECKLPIYSIYLLYILYVSIIRAYGMYLYSIAVCIFNLHTFPSDSAHQGNKPSETGGPGEEPVAEVCSSGKDHDGPATCQLQGLVPQSARFGRKPCTSTADWNMVIVSIILHILAESRACISLVHAYT